MALRLGTALIGIFLGVLSAAVVAQSTIGKEVSVPVHLADGDELAISLDKLIAHGHKLFTAVWTSQEGGGCPMTKGTGALPSDPSSPLTFPRNFNRISAPDANSCAGCHNTPFGIAGAGGDIVANVFVLGQRFDFATFDFTDPIITRGAVSENSVAAVLQGIANSRNTLGLFGSGFIEMLARQITADLQTLRDSIGPGGSVALTSKGSRSEFWRVTIRGTGSPLAFRAFQQRVLCRMDRRLGRASSFGRFIRRVRSSRYASSRTTPSTIITASSRPSGSASIRIPTTTDSPTS